MLSCDVCQSIAAATAPGGCVRETEHWWVDHGVGPLGVGILMIKPKRHVVHVADLQAAEAAELGEVLRRAAQVVTELERPEQVYVTLWSHMQAVPRHIHFVVHPASRARMNEYDGLFGAHLQVAMIDRGAYPDADEAAAFATRAREAWPR